MYARASTDHEPLPRLTVQRPKGLTLSLCQRRLLVVLLVCGFGCAGNDDPRYASPLATYATYLQGVLSQDTLAVWECFSLSFRKSEYDSDYAKWQAQWPIQANELTLAAKRRQIAEEGPINDRIAFVRFDVTTLASSRVTPFFYFIHDADGWKITSYLDSTFHAELERAIDEGTFTLPAY